MPRDTVRCLSKDCEITIVQHILRSNTMVDVNHEHFFVCMNTRGNFIFLYRRIGCVPRASFFSPCPVTFIRDHNDQDPSSKTEIMSRPTFLFEQGNGFKLFLFPQELGYHHYLRRWLTGFSTNGSLESMSTISLDFIASTLHVTYSYLSRHESCSLYS